MRQFAIICLLALHAGSVTAQNEGTQKPIVINQPPASALKLTGQYPGPFQDTLIQRWVDTANGNVCYLYIPVVLPSAGNQPTPSGQPGPRFYGTNFMGAISCVGAAEKP